VRRVAKFGLVALCSTMAVGSVIPDRRRRSKFGVSEVFMINQKYPE